MQSIIKTPGKAFNNSKGCLLHNLYCHQSDATQYNYDQSGIINYLHFIFIVTTLNIFLIFKVWGGMLRFLTTHALRLPVGVYFFNSVALELSSILYLDMYGVTHSRFVSL